MAYAPPSFPCFLFYTRLEGKEPRQWTEVGDVYVQNRDELAFLKANGYVFDFERSVHHRAEIEAGAKPNG